MGKPIYNSVTGNFDQQMDEWWNDYSPSEAFNQDQNYGSFGGYGELDPGEFKSLFGADVEDASNLLGAFTPHIEQVKQRLGEEQSGLTQVGHSLYRSIVGEMLGGTIENTGYLLDMVGLTDLMKNDMDEFGNSLSQFGASLREHAEEATPIYGNAEDMGSAAWWATNAPSVASTFSLLIPSGMAMKGLSSIGKALNVMQKTGKIGKAVRTGVGQAVISRHMENMMEARGTWESTLQTLEFEKRNLDIKGVENLSPEERRRYEKLSNEEERNLIAGEAARNNYVKGYAMLIQDIPQYVLLARGMKASNPVKDAKVAAAAGMSTAKANAELVKAGGWQMLSEGGEEAFQYALSENSRWRALEKAGIVEEKDRLGSYFNKQMATSAIFGALGAGFMQTAGKPVMDKIHGSASSKEAAERRVSDINSMVDKSTLAGSELLSAIKSGNKAGIKSAENALKFDIAYRNALGGNLNLGKETIDSLIENVSEEEAGSLEFQEDYKQRLESVKEDMDIVGKLFEKNSRKYDGEILHAVTKFEYDATKAQEKLDNANSKLQSELSSMPRVNELTPEGREEFDTKLDLKGLEGTKSEMEALIAAEKTKPETAEAAQRYLDTQIIPAIDGLKKQLKDFDAARAQVIADGSKGSIPFNKKRAAEKDASILKSVNTSLGESAVTAHIQKNIAEHELDRITTQLEEFTSDENIKALQDKQEADRLKAEKEAQALEQTQSELNTTDGIEGADNSVEGSRTELNGAEGGVGNVADAPGYEEKLEALRQKKAQEQGKPVEKKVVPGPKGTGTEDDAQELDSETSKSTVSDFSIDDYSDMDLMQQLGWSKEQVDAARKQRANEKNKKVVGASDAKARTVFGGNVPTALDEKNVNEDPTGTEESNSAMAETGHALAWHSYTGLPVEEIYSTDYANAIALANFLEDPSINMLDYTVELAVDLKALQQQEEYAAIASKVLNKEPLTNEEIASLPVIGIFRDGKGNPAFYKNDAGSNTYIKTTLHLPTFFDKKDRNGNYKLTEDKRTKAKDETLLLKTSVYDSYKKGNIISTPIVEQRKGSLNKSPNTQDGKFAKNTVSSAIGMPIEQVEFVFGNASKKYSTQIDGEVATDPDLFALFSASPGAIYAKILAANGETFPLRMMVENISDEEAELIHAIYSAQFGDPNLFTAPLADSTEGQEILRMIDDSKDYRIKGIAEVLDLSTVQFKDLLNFLVYEGSATESLNMPTLKMEQTKKGEVTVRMGDERMTQSQFKGELKPYFTEFLKKYRKRQVVASMLGNPAYKKYLEGAGIISTNATKLKDDITGETLFSGPTTIIGEPSEIPSKRSYSTNQSIAANPANKVGNEITTKSSNITRTPDQKNYVYTDPSTGETTILDRMSNWVGNQIELTAENHEILKTSSIIGQVADAIVRDYFTGELKNREHYAVDDVAVEDVMNGPFDAQFIYGETVSTTPVMNPVFNEKAFQELIDGLNKLTSPGGFLHNKTVYADKVMVADLDLGVAGELDLLVEDNETGDLYIIDTKTMTQRKMDQDGNIIEDQFYKQYTNKKTGKLEKSTGQSYSDQQNGYRVVIKRGFGKEIKGIFAMPVMINYHKRTAESSRASVGNLFEFQQHDINNSDVKLVPLKPADTTAKPKSTSKPATKSKIKNTGKTTTISPSTADAVPNKEWTMFTDKTEIEVDSKGKKSRKGKVYKKRLKAIADKVATGQPLSIRELSIYQDRAASIEKILQNKRKGNQTIQDLIDIEELQETNQLIYTEEDGTICAQVGGRTTNITPGSKWTIQKDLAGMPTHAKGGVDLSIGKGGVKLTGKDGIIKAKHGLVIPKQG